MSRLPGAALAGLGVLLVLVVGVYARVGSFDFVNFDDPEYVTANARVREGLSPRTLAWAFVGPHGKLWHPLTSLSHAADWQLFGAVAGGHHLVNVALHGLNTALVFAVFALLTRAPWRSLVLAALFALHPLRVESVAWVAERKDVLCGAFWFLTLGAWARYAERPSAPRYGLVLAAFALALMSKSMAVTLPLVLLLLDVWPLGRVARNPSPGQGSASAWAAKRRALLVEKLPLLGLAAAVSAITLALQWSLGAVVDSERLPLAVRLANVPISYVRYLWMTVAPFDLAVFYPYEPPQPPQVAAALLVLGAITALALLERRRRPYLAVGWLWFLVTLLPVIGLVQAGTQSVADRFTYVPQVGLLLAVVWAAADTAARFRLPRSAAGAVAAAVCAAALLVTHRQLAHWRDSESLFRRALAVAPENALAHNNMGEALARAGDFEAAAHHYEQSVRVHPDSPVARVNLGNALHRAGRREAARQQYHAALVLRPNFARALNGLGVVSAAGGEAAAAAEYYRRAVEVEPEYAEARANLGGALLGGGRVDEAIEQLSAAERLEPGWADVQAQLGHAFLRRGDAAAAERHLRRATSLEADDERARYDLGMVLLSQQRHAEAEVAFAESVRLAPRWAEARHYLGVARALGGKEEEALRAYDEALALRPEYVEVHRSRALTLRQLGREEEAQAELRKAGEHP